MKAKGPDLSTRTVSFDQLPLSFVHARSQASRARDAVVLATLLVALGSILGMAVAHAVAEPRSLSVLSDRPASAIQGLVGLGILIAILMLPVSRLVRRVGIRRVIEIDGSLVRVTETTLLGSRRWSEPLSAYRGIAHHVRASLSGLSHELVLVHADSRRNVVIAEADRLSQAAIDRAKDLLGLPEVPARSLYTRSSDAAPGNALRAEPGLVGAKA
jgi:hypothetical protein